MTTIFCASAAATPIQAFEAGPFPRGHEAHQSDFGALAAAIFTKVLEIQPERNQPPTAMSKRYKPVGMRDLGKMLKTKGSRMTSMATGWTYFINVSLRLK